MWLKSEIHEVWIESKVCATAGATHPRPPIALRGLKQKISFERPHR